MWPEIALRGSSTHADHRVALAERPSSSPRPEVGEVYADAVLLVWKPVESCGPVTYIVQCCIEGTGFLRLRLLCRVDVERHCGCGRSVSVGSLRKGVPLIPHNCFSLSWVARRQLDHPGL